MSQLAITFDFGNVVAFFDYARAFESIAGPEGPGGADLLNAARASGLAELVGRFEAGQLSPLAFSESAIRQFGLAVDAEAFASAWADIFWPNEAIVPLIRRLDRAGHRLVLGSNTNELHAAHFRQQFAETLSLFDRLVLSYEVGHIKPAPEFYLACAGAAGVPPGRCIFIDDLPENVEGARRAGLLGIHFRDVPTLEADLLLLGIEPDAT